MAGDYSPRAEDELYPLRGQKVSEIHVELAYRSRKYEVHRDWSDYTTMTRIWPFTSFKLV